MENRIKKNFNLKNATSVAFAFFKGENIALQMIVSRFLETNKIRYKIKFPPMTDKYSSHKSVNGKERLGGCKRSRRLKRSGRLYENPPKIA